MRSKMGTVVPKMGTTVHLAADQARYREAVAAALRAELGLTHQAIKTARRWTGASGAILQPPHRQQHRTEYREQCERDQQQALVLGPDDHGRGLSASAAASARRIDVAAQTISASVEAPTTA